VGGANEGSEFQEKGGKNMKIVSLCGGCGQCPVVKITDERVEIGEKDNICVLTKQQWETLKEKIREKEL
jgi:uncharacterized cysteine cluster protein YcgN (CxxCxxCC family)